MLQIVADSGCYLPPELIARWGIHIVPLKVHFGEAEVYDEITGISNREFYRRLTTEAVFPTTSQPPAGEFLAAYRRALATGADHILVLTLSGRLSGTFNAARAAAAMLPDAPITCFDSRSLGLGVGLMILVAAEMNLAGQPLPAILKRLQTMRDDLRVFILFDTLEYLRRGGRIGNASAFVGGLLRIKPLLTLRDGILQPLGKVRTRRKAIERMLAEVQAAVPDRRAPVYLAAMHADAPESLPPLQEALRAHFPNIRRFLTGEIGPTVGAHAGPRTLAVGICPA